MTVKSKRALFLTAVIAFVGLVAYNWESLYILIVCNVLRLACPE